MGHTASLSGWWKSSTTQTRLLAPLFGDGSIGAARVSQLKWVRGQSRGPSAGPVRPLQNAPTAFTAGYREC